MIIAEVKTSRIQSILPLLAFIVAFPQRINSQVSPSRYLNYHTKTELHLPFEGNWLVFWGGRSLDENYHAISREQRFAYDFEVVDGAGKPYRSAGKHNRDYYCFGKKILATGDGVVFTAKNNVSDNQPSILNANQLLGNHVILDHGNGEFSFFAHLRKGSVKVKTGQSVTAGQKIGECGNSGHTSRPHLHYHLQTTPNLLDGEGLPPQFQNYFVHKKLIKRGEPVKGQIVRPSRFLN